jgi:hypothetical protein
MTGALIIILAWYLNAAADAIDHGKGARSLYELWHIIKAVSYGLLFAYIVYVEHWPWWMIVLILIIMQGWEIIYRFLRQRDFQELDDKIKIPWLRWIWGIKR